MADQSWSSRFLDSTRGQVVQLLRRQQRTVGELADLLEVTDPAIRAHLVRLERDGLVELAAKRPGTRKPEYVYALTPAAEQLFPKAYDLLIRLVLDVLEERLEPGETEALLREVGERIADLFVSSVAGTTVEERSREAVAVLERMGGLAELEPGGRSAGAEGLQICGISCPLGGIVDGHPDVCLLAETLLETLIGAPVTQRCRHEGRSRCTFEIGRG